MSVVEEQTIKITVAPDEEGTRRQTLLKAAEIIAKNGWVTGAAGVRAGGNYCILGAVAVAMGLPMPIQAEPDYTERTINLYRKTAAFLGICDHGEATSWNDENARDADEVKAALRRMANGKSFHEAIGAPGA